MESIILLKLNEDELSNIIRKVLKEEITQLVNDLRDSPPTDNTLISRTEAAKLLMISLPTIYNYMKSGRIPYLKVGRKILFKKGELLKALDMTPNIGRRKNQSF